MTSLGVFVTLFAVSQSLWAGKVRGGSTSSDAIKPLTRVGSLKSNPQQVIANDFGCVGDGEHDDTAALQRVIDQSQDRQILLPAGQYRITSPLRVQRPIQIVGEGLEHTEILADSTGAFIFSTPQDSALGSARRKSVLQGFSMKTVGKAVASTTGVQLLTAEDNVELNFVRISAFDLGIVAKNFASVKIANSQVLGTLETAVHLESASTNSEAFINNVTIESASLDASTSGVLSVGFEISNLHRLAMEGVRVRGGSIGLRFHPALTGLQVKEVRISKSQWMNQQLNAIQVDNKTNLVESFKLKDVSIESAGHDGIVVRGSAIQNLEWQGGTVRFCGGHGFRIERASQVSIMEAHILQNSRRNRNMFHGVSISSHSNNISILDSQIENIEDDDSGQLYGVYVVGSSNHSIHLEGNRWSANGSPCPFAAGCSTYLGQGVYAITGTGNVPELKFTTPPRSPASVEVSTGPRAEPLPYQ